MNEPKYKHPGATGYLGSVIWKEDNFDLYYYKYLNASLGDILIINRFGNDNLYACTDVKTIAGRTCKCPTDYVNALAVQMLRDHLSQPE